MSPSSPEEEEDNDGLEHFERDLDFLLCDLPSPSHRRNGGGSGAFVDIQRSGSAPPTVEGSSSLLWNSTAACEEDIRSHPSYVSYYYSNENQNPRLPPPGVSREGWRAAQRVQTRARISLSPIGTEVGDRRRMEVGGGSAVRELRLGGDGSRSGSSQCEAVEWVEKGNDGLTGLGLGARKKSFADVLQEELSQATTAFPAHHSHVKAYNSFSNFIDPDTVPNGNMIHTMTPESVDKLHSPTVSTGLTRMQSSGSSHSNSLASGPGFPRSITPDPQLIQRSPSPRLPPTVARSNLPSNGYSTSLTANGDIAVALSGMNLTDTGKISDEKNNGEGRVNQELAGRSNCLVNVPQNKNHYLQQNVNSNPKAGLPSDQAVTMMTYKESFKKNEKLSDHSFSNLCVNGQGYLSKGSSSRHVVKNEVSFGSNGYEDSTSLYTNTELPNTGYAGINTKSFMNQKYTEKTNNQLDTGGMIGQYFDMSGNHVGQVLQAPYAEYMQRIDLPAQPASNFDHPALGRNYTDVSPMDISYQKAYLEALAAQRGLPYGMPLLGKSTGLNYAHGCATAYPTLPYATNSLSSSILSSRSPVDPLRLSEQLSGLPSMIKNSNGSLGLWTAETGSKETGLGSSFLEEFKNSKTRSFELSEIVGHLFEFSTDQYGSRFIQQKLETASIEEKNLIFPEILSHSRALMTDVFGNYVIQKFFEHGTESQRKQLARQLKGHVLALSLQMYGCRVIQKALEAVDEVEQTQMVSELDGSVIKCVRDQNGNHVIQKCIECVPQEKIQFIISTFYGQVVTLSTHPYGCRVIQRVLENCDAKTQSIMMEEILQSVTTLALDQYGNYVVQHVLQHGKPEERTAIISTLSGQIVNMSQQKFASNVVEKCLTYGTAEERQILINEMLGSTDENEPLQAMMKDQFGNYVVQKVLDLCDDHNRELILSRIKIHLTALKRFTYGKHIVARVEKLVTNEERRMGILSYSS